MKIPESLASLSEFIKHSDVTILLPGSSLKYLDKVNPQTILATVNHYWLMEKFGKIDILLAAAEENKEDIARYQQYADDGGFLLTTRKFSVTGKNVIYFITDEPNIIRQVPNEKER